MSGKLSKIFDGKEDKKRHSERAKKRLEEWGIREWEEYARYVYSNIEIEYNGRDISDIYVREDAEMPLGEKIEQIYNMR